MMKFWKDYKKKIIGGIITIVILPCIYSYLKKSDKEIVTNSNNIKQSNNHVAVINSDNVLRDKITNNYYQNIKDSDKRKQEDIKTSQKKILVKKQSIKPPVASPSVYNNHGNLSIGQKGGTVIQNNYQGEEQRHINDDDKNILLKSIPSKEVAVSVFFSHSKKAANIYGTEIATFLQQKGYKVQVPFEGFHSFMVNPPLPETQRIYIENSDSEISIHVVNLD